MSEQVVYEVDGRVATVELNRPEVKNAIDAPTIDRLREVFDDLCSDGAVDVIRLSGRGDTFCAGFDLDEMRDDLGGMTYENYVRHAEGIEGLQAFSRTLRASDAVLVSQVEGYAVGAGCELALISDICIAAELAEFGFPETHVGLSITNGGTNLLPRFVGLQKAKLMALTGQRISGREADDAGPSQVLVPVSGHGAVAHQLIDFARRTVDDGTIGVCAFAGDDADLRRTERMLADLIEPFDARFDVRITRSSVCPFLADAGTHYDLVITDAATVADSGGDADEWGRAADADVAVVRD
jgi:enoyl-CoA hydratase/carnithine racemase